MGCIEASVYNANPTGTILGGPYTSQSGCEEDCGLCCVWGCDVINTGNHIFGDGVYNIFSQTMFFTPAGCNTTILLDTDDYIGIYSNVSAFITKNNNYGGFVLKSGFPEDGNDYYIAQINYNKSWSDGGGGWSAQETAEVKETYYYECVSGMLIEKSGLNPPIDPLYLYDAYGDGSVSGLIGVDGSKIVQNEVIGDSYNYSYTSAQGGSVDSGYYYYTDSSILAGLLATGCPLSGYNPDDCFPMAGLSTAFDCNIPVPNDETDVVVYTCNDSVTKSGCLQGGQINTSGIALGIWFSGIDCTIANSGYSGCSGLVNL